MGRGDAALGRGAEAAPGTHGILTALSEKGASLGKIWGRARRETLRQVKRVCSKYRQPAGVTHDCGEKRGAPGRWGVGTPDLHGLGAPGMGLDLIQDR